MGAPVFHPGHDDLHGITVVVYTHGSKTYVGRWDAERGGTVHIVGASVHDAESDSKSRDEFLSDTRTYGVAVTEPSLNVPRDSISKVVKLGDLQL